MAGLGDYHGADTLKRGRRMQVDLGARYRPRQFLQTVKRATFRQFVGKVLGVVVSKIHGAGYSEGRLKILL